MTSHDSSLSAARPWPGLREFTESDREFFFGRDKEAVEVAKLIQRAPATLIYGESGLGKTSLLQAGVFPRLREIDLLPVAVRFSYDARAPRPAELIRSALEREISAARASGPEFRDRESLWEYLHRHGNDLWSWGNRLLTPVFVIDQFEEAFTLGQATLDAGERVAEAVTELQHLIEARIPPAVRRKFEENPKLASDFELGRRPAKVVVVVRNDFFPLVDGLRDKLPSLLANRYRLEGMSRSQAVAAIINPGKEVVTLEVADQIVDFVSGAPLSDSSTSDRRPPSTIVEPALLCLVCQQLNERRIEDGLSTIPPGLVRDSSARIVDDFYDQAFAGMAPQTRAWIERELLTPSGYRDRAALETAVRDQVREKDLLELVRRRLLHAQERDRIVWLELSHDLLTSPARRSRDLRHEQAAGEAGRRAEEQAIRALRALFDEPGAEPLRTTSSIVNTLPASSASRALCTLLAAELCCDLGQYRLAGSYVAMTDDVPGAPTAGLRSYVSGLIAMETGPLRHAQECFQQSLERAQAEVERFDLDAVRSEILSQLRLVEIARRQLDFPTAETRLSKAMQSLDNVNPQIPRDEVELWRLVGRLQLGAIHGDQNSQAEAMESLAETHELYRSRLQAPDLGRRWRRLEVALLLGRGRACLDRDAFEARHYVACAIASSTNLAATAEDFGAALLLTMCHSDAIEIKRSAIERGQPVASNDPKFDPGSKRVDWSGELRDQLDLLAQAQHVLAALHTDAPWTTASRTAAIAYRRRADVAEDGEQGAMARSYFAAGRDVLVDLTARVTDDSRLWRDLSILRASAARLEPSYELQVEGLRCAAGELELVPTAARFSRPILEVEVYLHSCRASIFGSRAMHTERLRALQDAENAARELADRQPSPADQERLVYFWRDMAEAHATLSHRDEAPRALEIALDIIDQALAAPLVQKNHFRKFRLKKAALETRCCGLWLAAGSLDRATFFLQQATEGLLLAWSTEPYDVEVEALIRETEEQAIELLRQQREGAGEQPELRELLRGLADTRSFSMKDYVRRGMLLVAPVSQTFVAHPLIGGCWRALGKEALRSVCIILNLGQGDPQRGRALPLEFYDGASLIEVEVATRLGLGTAARVVHQSSISIIDGTSAWIHKLNEDICLRLDSPEIAAKYLAFFVSSIQGDEGRFEIVQRADELRWASTTPARLRADVAATIRPLVMYGGQDGRWTATSTVRFGDTLAYSVFRLKRSGEVEMAHSQEIASDLPISVEYFCKASRLTIPGEELRMVARIAAYEQRWEDASASWSQWVEARKIAAAEYGLGESERGELFHDLAKYQVASTNFEQALASAQLGLRELESVAASWRSRLQAWRVIALACLERRAEAEEIWQAQAAASAETDGPSWAQALSRYLNEMADVGLSRDGLTWLRTLVDN